MPETIHRADTKSRSRRPLPKNLLGAGVILAGISLFLSACSSGPISPVLIPSLMAPPVQTLETTPSLTTLYLLPTQLPPDMTNVGTLFKLNGEYAGLITEKPLVPSLDAILLRNFKASGVSVLPSRDPSHGATLQLTIIVFHDRVKERFLHTRQTGTLEMKAVLVLHSEGVTRTLTRSIERHSSPSPGVSFERRDPSILLGGLFSDAVNKDLIPYVKKKMEEGS